MLAAYSTRRTSVVLNPRGRVLGGLGAEEGYGGDAPPGGGDVPEGNYGITEAQAFAASQIANEAALVAASKALAQSKVDNAATAKTMATIANTAVGFMGPIGLVAGLISRATGFVENAFRDSLDNQQLSYDTNIKSAEQALADARGPAGSDAALVAEINKVQKNIDSAKNAYTQAQINEAIRVSKQTFSDADVITGLMRRGMSQADAMAALNRFYAFSSTTTAAPAGAGGGLALPIIAAVAGFLIFRG